MSTLQLYAYIIGFIFFLFGCYFYYLSRNKDLSNDQKLIKSQNKVIKEEFDKKIKNTLLWKHIS